ncbi:pantoate--beta-alanine ligase [Pseudonocardia sp. HH130630-07]|uniref:pantoate--beta-alanine ligase n=1 Tax=Pseudonocardia sp. HH130630-07 TaxID=1690815 RepID=UPI0008151443|nr:pantoate--beta-alanine ligase [Pseudonocardia sp. HH130630-07]ANY07053.1 pantoate--beta-alanine ligase [Pseudonocardia sp. HH130630-07]
MSTTRNGYAPGRLTVHSDPAKLGPVTRALRGAGRKVVLIPTMGALHDGHRELIRHARRVPGSVVPVVSIFVNPLQFGAGEDLDRYPRPLEADLDVCREEGVELVFTPQPETMYPPGSDTRIAAGALGDDLEGASRKGHFDGVLTVVAKLLHIVAPDVVMFGEKDYQQLTLVRRMVRDLDFGVHVVGVPTVREDDGTARSSRNVFLDADRRPAAAVLSRALRAGAAVSARGPDAVLAAARAELETEPGVVVDYLELRGADLGPAPDHGDGRLLVAARVGSTRLIDNIAIAL